MAGFGKLVRPVCGVDGAVTNPIENTLFGEPIHLSLFRSLLLEKLGWEANSGDINQIPQWAGFLRSLGEPPIASAAFERTHLEGGYFYGFHNPTPSENEIADAIVSARKKGIQTWLVPTIEESEDITTLTRNHFEKIPAYIESALILDGSLENNLRASIGSRRLLDFQRITRKAEELFTVRFYTYSSLTERPELLSLAGDVHGENSSKYGHPFNMYDGTSLSRILSSPLGKHLAIGLVEKKTSGSIVQAILALVDKERSQLHYLAQGIRHEAVPASVNLYTASYLWLYRFGEANGIRVFFLSRGMHQAKRRLGANRFWLLNHWMKSDSNDGQAAISIIQRRAQDCLLPVFHELTESTKEPNS